LGHQGRVKLDGPIRRDGSHGAVRPSGPLPHVRLVPDRGLRQDAQRLAVPWRGRIEPVLMPDGDFYDRCPADGCLEVDAAHRSEGRPTGALREGAHEWSIYSADLRQGGCGAVWSRTNASGQARDAARGIQSANLTSAAAASRSYSLPS